VAEVEVEAEAEAEAEAQGGEELVRRTDDLQLNPYSIQVPKLNTVVNGHHHFFPVI
jgi:hypothetical protein